MKTTIEVTLKIEVEHPDNPLDENSVKALINRGTAAVFLNSYLLSTIGDESTTKVSTSVVRLKQSGKQQALSLYGTDSVPWRKLTATTRDVLHA